MKWGKRQPTIVSRFVREMRADDEQPEESGHAEADESM
jgi:hypothetical protein